MDRDVVVRGEMPVVSIAAPGPDDGSIKTTTDFEVIGPDGSVVVRRCKGGKVPISGRILAVTLDLTCYRLDRPGVYTIRVNPAKFGQSGDVAELPIRVLADAPTPSSVPANWRSFALARAFPNVECFYRGESYRVVAGDAGVQMLRWEPPPPVTLPPALRDRMSPERARAVRDVFPREDGWLVTWNKGEFGGGVEWYSRTGGAAQPIVIGSEDAIQNVNRAVVVNGDFYVLQGFDNMVVSEGQLAKVWREHGRFLSHVVARYASGPFDWIREPEGTWLVATLAGIWRTSEARSKELVTRLPDLLFYPNSVVEAPNGTFYIGTRRGVLRLTPTWPDAPRFAADFLLPNDSRSEACWQGRSGEQD